LALLNLLPPHMDLMKHQQSLQNHAHAAKKWSRRFREDWSLRWGSSSIPHGISTTATRTRAGIFARWLRYVLEVELAGRNRVVVNMDETMLSNVKPWKLGVASSRLPSRSNAAPRARPLSRITLMASVCSDGELQDKLPQIRLPRSPSELMPSRPLMRAYQDAGAPQIAWHGGSGWATTDVVCWYIRLLAKTVRRYRPGCAVVLVWDCAPTHLAERTLRAARAASVTLVFVPGRMTWALQPLDTHVFAVLKQTIRKLEFEEQVASREARVPSLQRVRIHGRAIRQVLVGRSWASCLSRSGLTGNFAAARDDFKALVASEDLQPRAPSAAELADILQMPLERAAATRCLLINRGLGLPVQESAAGASSGPAAAPEPVGSDAVVRGFAPLMLSPSMRLPRRPSTEDVGSNVWLPAVGGRRPQTRSMTASRAALLASALVAAAPPPLPPPMEPAGEE
jgi:hypothetical protein